MNLIPENRRIYHSWGFDPHVDVVHINDKKDYDQNGYAYRINGGWRLTDREHDPVNDPYIVKRVMGALNGDNGQKPIEPMDYNFDKLHYGQPLPKER
jgi:hypothetical protein